MLIEGTTLQLVGGIISGVRCLSGLIFSNIYPASPDTSAHRKVLVHVIMFYQQLTHRRTNPQSLRQHQDPSSRTTKATPPRVQILPLPLEIAAQ
jgi:hypothetical protein